MNKFSEQDIKNYSVFVNLLNIFVFLDNNIITNELNNILTYLEKVKTKLLNYHEKLLFNAIRELLFCPNNSREKVKEARYFITSIKY